jgi:glucose/arabinose dehydrogenase
MRRIIELMLILLLTEGTLHSQEIVEAFPHLAFRQPIFLTYAPDGTDRIFVAQQDGIIKVFLNDSTATIADTLVNLSTSLSSSNGEEGLLGLAFDPDFTLNGRFYVNYTAPSPLRTVVRRFTIPSATPNAADPASGFIIIEIDQPFTNHNGGMITFGPDGYFYIGMGDGGSGGDPLNNAQDRTKLLGKILRIDVRDTTPTTHYVIPPDNPFVGNSSGYREEIWAYGLRNPWRFSFDPATGQLWAGDVGQNSWEEVDLIERGKNYGWRIMEGFHCYTPSSGCDTTGLTLPIVEYSHSFGIAVTGGYVYRGSARPDLIGAYLYGDYGSGRIWMSRYDNATLTKDSLLLQFPRSISSFGADSHQELYIVSYDTSANNKIYRFARSDAVSVDKEAQSTVLPGYSLKQNYPNPFNGISNFGFSIADFSHVSLKIFDVLGQKVATLVSDNKPAGTYTVQFDASGLASGIYFYRLRTERFISTKKLILLK